jgi:hypothetical protein
MVLDHERLDVYAVALEFLVFANEVIERLPRGRYLLSGIPLCGSILES